MAIIVTTRHFGGTVRHRDHHGRPACGAPAEGAFVVDSSRSVTCPDCAIIGAAVAIVHVQAVA